LTAPPFSNKPLLPALPASLHLLACSAMLNIQHAESQSQMLLKTTEPIIVRHSTAKHSTAKLEKICPT